MMNDWNYIPEQPISLTLAADARLTTTDYFNDQIWELNIAGSDPPSISIETTFGLRARQCRIFPLFNFEGQVVSDPTQFFHPITIHRYYPNYVELSCKPFSSVNVKMEYWVPSSQAVAGRIFFANTRQEDINFQFQLAEQLMPTSNGSRMSANEIGMTIVLVGKTSDISPILFLTGGAQVGNSPYPALDLSVTIPARGVIETRWVHASLSDVNTSLDLARGLLNQNWDAEIARITRINSRSLEIHTGNKDWDIAFRISQNIAYQLFQNPKQNASNVSFISLRRPDHGYSLLKDGSDYSHLWNGQSALDSLYLINFLLPSSPQYVKAILDNFLATQNPEGEIDLKPGLSGQRSHIEATPVLSEIALRLYEYTLDDKYLNKIFPKLLAFFFSWFSKTHDRDGDQIPEWDQIIQAGTEDFPLFSQHHPRSLGADISVVESPALASFLHRESTSLIEIALLTNNNASIPQLEMHAAVLKSMLEQTWNDEFACYLYRDRDSHASAPGEDLGTLLGPGVIEVHREFTPPVRPIFQLESKEEITHAGIIFIHGTGVSGAHRVELISANQIHWHHRYGYVTSEQIYNTLERIEVNGTLPDDIVFARTIDFYTIDQSLLLPLWAGIPSKERAKKLINLSIMNTEKFLTQFGIRSCVHLSDSSELPGEEHHIHLPLTDLVLDGFVQYGEKDTAAEVFVRLMAPIISSLHTNLALHQSYHSETGKPLGARNELQGLVPIGSFLKILGIKIISPEKVEISGQNPFPWPVTLKFRGLTIIKQEKKTLLIFPDGYNITVDNEKTQLITRGKKHPPG